MNLNLKQQINLHRPHSKSGPRMSFERILILWLGLSMILFLLILDQKWDLHVAQKEKVSLSQKQQILNEELATLSVKKKIMNTKAKQQSKMALVTTEIEDKQNLIQILINDKKEKPIALSEYLGGLILTHVNGTYLSYIYANKDDHQIAFAGVALDAQLVPMMLDSWQKIPALQDTQFNKVSLHRLGKKNPWIQFDLRAQE